MAGEVSIKDNFMKKLLQYSFVHAFGVFAYIFLIAWTMTNLSRWIPGPDTFLAPVAMLSLFVVSAAITGALVLGKPILMYINGEKSGAIKLFLLTVAWLFVFVVIVFAFMVLQ